MTFTTRILAVFALMAPLASGSLSIQAQESKAGALTIMHPWARPTHGNVPLSAAYFTIQNKGTKPDRLLSIAGEIAGRIEIHETIKVGDIAKMQPVIGGVEIPAGGTAELKPLGKHVMLMRLNKKLGAGDVFPLTLVFENQGEVKIEVKVEKPGSSASSKPMPKAGSHRGSH